MRQLFALAAFFAALFLGAAGPHPAAAAKYEASGVCIHQCSCAYACPCMFENGPPDCELAAVYHLDHAAYAGVDISGLSMISVDGTKTAGGGVVYLDSRATPAQKAALLGLLAAHGEWPGPGRPVRSVPIAFTPTAHGYKTSVPGIFDGVAEQVKSRSGSAVTVDGVGFAEGKRWTVGRSVVNDLHDPALGLHWHLPGTNGSWTALHWAS